MNVALLQPLVVLVLWTFVTAGWLIAVRAPFIRKSKDPQAGRHTRDLTMLPPSVRSVADNYNHLHEQPTLFYAIVLASLLVGFDHPVQVGLAWAYVGLRVVHTLVQNSTAPVMGRFLVFVVASLVLLAMTVHLAIVVF